MADSERIDVRDLPRHMRNPGSAADEIDSDLDDAAAELLPLSKVYRKYVLRVLARVGGNKLRASKILGINRATLYRLLEEEETARTQRTGSTD